MNNGRLHRKRSCTLFMCNVERRVSKELLFDVFRRAGPIKNLVIRTDSSGVLCSYGFITYNDQSSTSFALVIFQGLSFYGRKIVLKRRRLGNAFVKTLKRQFNDTLLDQQSDTSILESSSPHGIKESRDDDAYDNDEEEELKGKKFVD